MSLMDNENEPASGPPRKIRQNTEWKWQRAPLLRLQIANQRRSVAAAGALQAGRRPRARGISCIIARPARATGWWQTCGRPARRKLH